MKNIIFTLSQINKKFGLYDLLNPKTFMIFALGFFVNLSISISIGILSGTLSSLSAFVNNILISSGVYLLVILFIVVTLIIALTSIYMFDIRHILFDKNQLNNKILKIFFPLFFLIGIKKLYSKSDYSDRDCICCKDKLKCNHFTSGYLDYECKKCNIVFIIDLKYNNLSYLKLFINDSDYTMEKYMEDEIPRYAFFSSDKYFEKDVLTEIKTINDFFRIIKKYEENKIFL